MHPPAFVALRRIGQRLRSLESEIFGQANAHCRRTSHCSLRVSSRAAQTARDLTIARRLACARETLFERAVSQGRKLIRTATVRSLAVCAARDDSAGYTPRLVGVQMNLCICN